jgi:Flp pilus assembly secretin CpaC
MRRLTAFTLTLGLCGFIAVPTEAASVRRKKKTKRIAKSSVAAPAQPSKPPLLTTNNATLTAPVTTTPAGKKIVYLMTALPLGGLSSPLMARPLPPPAPTRVFGLSNGSGFDPSSNKIEVPVGMFVTMTKTNDIRSVAIADEKIADVAVISPRAVLINGKSPGTTSLVLHGDKGLIQQYEVRVVAQSPNIMDEMTHAIALPDIRASLVRNSVVLEGEVESDEQKKKAVAVAQLYNPNVVDLLRVRTIQPSSEGIIEQIQKELGLPGLLVRILDGKTVLSGEVDTAEEKTRIESIARLHSKGEVVNLTQIRPYTAEELQNAIGTKNVTVRVLRDAVFLDGTVESQAEINQIEEFVRKRAGGKDVLNRVRVVAPAPTEPPKPMLTFAEQLQQNIGLPTVRVSGTQNMVVLEGTVKDGRELQRTLAVVQNTVGDAQKVQNFLAVRTPDQVRIEVSVIELNLERLRELGVDYPSSFLFSEGTGAGGVRTSGSPTTRQTPFSFTVRVPAHLRSDVKVLSQPNTIVLSGKTAKFQVGGEVPIPSANVSTAGQNISAGVDYRPFGIVMNAAPTVDALGNVHLKIQTEVSELGPTFRIVQGSVASDVPSFLTRTSDTEVYLKDGQTLVLGGLIEHRDEKTITKFPFLGNIPILGELFTSRRFQRRETELVIFVTPRLMKDDEEG